jgi:hypothetical protein
MIMKLKTYLILVGVMQTLFIPLPGALAGNEGAHGGDPYGLEFQTLGHSVLDALSANDPNLQKLELKWHFTATDFANALQSVHVVSGEHNQVILNGNEVDAINNESNNQILVNRTRWREDDLISRVQLVLHEYFGILNVERDRYDASFEFAFLTQAVAKKISSQDANHEFMANLFYGFSESIPALTDESTCKAGSDSLTQATARAESEAQNKCLLSGKSKCSLVSTTYDPKLSETEMGLRYCEITSIVQ